MITHGPFMKSLGVGGSRADVTVTGSVLPGAKGVLWEWDTQSLVWVCVFVSQIQDSPLVCGNLHTTSCMGSFWQISSLTWKSLAKFTTVRQCSGSAHVLSLGFVNIDSWWTLSHVCVRKWEGRHLKMYALSMYFINMPTYWKKWDAFHICPPQLTVLAKQVWSAVKMYSLPEDVGNKKKTNNSL